jgi:hypothetical protein
MAKWSMQSDSMVQQITAENLKYDPSVYAASLSTCDASNKTIELLPHQRVIADLLAPDSPIRGVLLYHGLGAGKTCSAIHASSPHVGTRKVVVLLPASLVSNAVREITKCGPSQFLIRQRWASVPIESAAAAKEAQKTTGVPWSTLKRHGRAWTPVGAGGGGSNGPVDSVDSVDYDALDEAARAEVSAQLSHRIKGAYGFYAYNGLTAQTTAKLVQLLSTKPCFVVVDEMHNFVSRVMNNPSSYSARVFEALCRLPEARVVALSGTPLINRPREIAYITALVKGYAELQRLGVRFQRATSLVELRKALEGVAEVAALEGANFSRGVVLVRLVPRGFERDSRGELTYVGDPAGTWTKRALQRTAAVLAAHGCQVLEHSVEFRQFVPLDEDGFSEKYLAVKKDEGLVLKNTRHLAKRMLGMVSFFNVQNEALFPSRSEDVRVDCPVSVHQYKRYAEVRLDEINRETLAARRAANAETRENANNVYKAFSRLTLNFTFPDAVKRPFPSHGDELATDDDSDATGSYGEAIQAALKGLRDNADEYLVRDLAVYSPKMAAMIERLRASPGTSLVYSQYRSLEGVGIIAEALRALGYAELDVRGGRIVTPESDFAKPMFIVFGGDHDRDDMGIMLDFFNSQPEKLPSPVADAYRKMAALKGVPEDEGNLRGKMVGVLAITQSGAEGVNLRNVRQVHLLEPYWNDIRAEQVIGRAIRTCSHHGLPEKERDVKIYRYVGVIPKSMVDPKSRIATTDRHLSVDELLLAVAQRKKKLLMEVLSLMHRSAIDCRLHAKVHPGTNCLILHSKGPAFFLDSTVDNDDGLVDITIKGERMVYDARDGRVFKERSTRLQTVGRLLPAEKSGKRGLQFVAKEASKAASKGGVQGVKGGKRRHREGCRRRRCVRPIL